MDNEKEKQKENEMDTGALQRHLGLRVNLLSA